MTVALLLLSFLALVEECFPVEIVRGTVGKIFLEGVALLDVEDASLALHCLCEPLNIGLKFCDSRALGALTKANLLFLQFSRGLTIGCSLRRMEFLGNLVHSNSIQF